MSRHIQPQRIEGGEKRVLTSDERTIQLLTEISTTLKKIEYHLTLHDDTELKDEDV